MRYKLRLDNNDQEEQIFTKIQELKKSFGEVYLDLSTDYLGKESGTKLAILLKILKDPAMTQLDLQGTVFGSTDILITILDTLKHSKATRLNLSWNSLGKKSSTKLTNIFGALNTSRISHLNLSGNHFGQKSGTELATMLAALNNSGITHLDLGWNNFGQKSGAELATILAALNNSGVTHLGLGWNDLYKKSGTELATMFAALNNSGITHLDLRWNYLYKKPDTELAIIFDALKDSGVTHLDLRENRIKEVSDVQLYTIFAAIPENITSVCFDYSELKQMTQAQRQAIQARFPNAKNIILRDENNKKLKPELNIADARAYRELGFNTSVPSLFNISTFFVAHNTKLFKEGYEQKLPSELNERIARFGS